MTVTSAQAPNLCVLSTCCAVGPLHAPKDVPHGVLPDAEPSICHQLLHIPARSMVQEARLSHFRFDLREARHEGEHCSASLCTGITPWPSCRSP